MEILKLEKTGKNIELFEQLKKLDNDFEFQGKNDSEIMGNWSVINFLIYHKTEYGGNF